MRWPKQYLLICHCGKSFLRPRAHIRNKTHSCSQNCARKIKPKRQQTITQHICARCGAPFTRRKGYSGPAKYCSKVCGRAGSGVTRSGAGHHGWKGGVSERSNACRLAIKKRVEEAGACEACGTDKNLQGHHIKSHAEYPDLRSDPSNIRVLCVTCHAEEHPSLRFLVLAKSIKSQS